MLVQVPPNISCCRSLLPGTSSSLQPNQSVSVFLTALADSHHSQNRIQAVEHSQRLFSALSICSHFELCSLPVFQPFHTLEPVGFLLLPCLSFHLYLIASPSFTRQTDLSAVVCSSFCCVGLLIFSLGGHSSCCYISCPRQTHTVKSAVTPEPDCPAHGGQERHISNNIPNCIHLVILVVFNFGLHTNFSPGSKSTTAMNHTSSGPFKEFDSPKSKTRLKVSLIDHLLENKLKFSVTSG